LEPPISGGDDLIWVSAPDEGFCFGLVVGFDEAGDGGFILPDGTRQRASLFSGFLSHYLLRDRYRRPGKGNDKGNLEGLAGYSRPTS
jgi:hypothetical protein